MLTMLEKVSAFTEDSRVSKSHLGNENRLTHFALRVIIELQFRKCYAKNM